MTYATTVTTKGQVTIPISLRYLLGLKAGKKVIFEKNPAGSGLILKSISDLLSYKGFFKSEKKYSKAVARKAFLKDVVAGRV